jgi:peptidoglycan hydrolase-like protein with peptidoglycan-binding domain
MNKDYTRDYTRDLPKDLPWEESDYAPQPKRQAREQRPYPQYEEELAAPPRRPAAPQRRKSFSFGQFIFARPLDSLAMATAGFFVVGIMVNALAFQKKPMETARVVASSQQQIRVAEVVTPPVVAQPLPPMRMVEKMMTIEEAQAELKKRGLYKEAVDGQMGSKTAAAIKEFQKQAGLRLTGEVNDEVSLALKAGQTKQTTSFAVPAAQKANIADLIGDDSETRQKKPLTTASINMGTRPVLKVQEALASIGYGPVKIDGVYTIETRNAIERFEKDRKIPVTGQVTPRLLRELSAVTGLAVE